MARRTERLSDLVRMLNLLPYFEAHPERSVMEAARDLGRSPGEIMDDLNRLWCCGLPGLMPGDLVDMDHDYRRVRVTNAQGMNKPLRLTTTEAAALLLALENLEGAPGLVEKASVESAAAKLRGIMGETMSAVVEGTAADDPSSDTVALLRQSIDDAVQVSFDYHSESSGSIKRRTVSVARMFLKDGETYIAAWEAASNSHRTFRVDRMREVSLSSEPAEPNTARLKFSADDPFSFSRSRKTAQLEVAQDYAWIADYVPIVLTGQAQNGWIPAKMPVGSEQWLVRFVLACGGKVKLTGPEKLTALVCERASSALAAYDGTMDPSTK